MTLDQALIDILSQVPISIALLVVLIYVLRTNRQDRHELNAIAQTQTQTSLLSAQNQAQLTQRTAELTERTEVTETLTKQVSLKLDNQTTSLGQLANAMTALAQALKEVGAAVSAIRTRDEADRQSQTIVASINGHTSAALEPLARGVEAVKSTLSDATPKLDALTVKVGDIRLVKDQYDALVAERNAEREQKQQLQARVDLLTKQNADMTGEAMTKDKAIELLTAKVASLTTENAALREIGAKLKAQLSPDVQPATQPSSSDACGTAVHAASEKPL